MRIQYKCKCRHIECKCDFLNKFECKLEKNVNTKVVHIYCDDDKFPSVDALYLISEYIPTITNLILKNIDFYDLPTLFDLISKLPHLERLSISCYKHSNYCYDEDLPLIKNIILPPHLKSFKFIYCGDPCDSCPVNIHPNIFEYPTSLEKLSLKSISWPINLERFENLQCLELFGLSNESIQFPSTLKKLTLNHIDRWTVARCFDFDTRQIHQFYIKNDWNDYFLTLFYLKCNLIKYNVPHEYKYILNMNNNLNIYMIFYNYLLENILKIQRYWRLYLLNK